MIIIMLKLTRVLELVVEVSDMSFILQGIIGAQHKLSGSASFHMPRFNLPIHILRCPNEWTSVRREVLQLGKRWLIPFMHDATIDKTIIAGPMCQNTF